MMLHSDCIFIVEGVYDKDKLAQIVDAPIFCCHGFRIYTDDQLKNLLKTMAKGRGAVVLTDSDRAGFQLRAYIKNMLQGCQVTDVFIPDVYGKERRKKSPSKEGKVGVEGIDANTLRQLIVQSGVTDMPTAHRAQDITKQLLYQLGLIGAADSSQKRRAVCAHYNLPQRLSTKNLVVVLNEVTTADQLQSFVESSF